MSSINVTHASILQEIEFVDIGPGQNWTIKYLLLENNTKLHQKGPGYCELKMLYLISLKCNDCHVAKHVIGERARFPRSWFRERY